jgi:hypothetical protein
VHDHAKGGPGRQRSRQWEQALIDWRGSKTVLKSLRIDVLRVLVYRGEVNKTVFGRIDDGAIWLHFIGSDGFRISHIAEIFRISFL